MEGYFVRTLGMHRVYNSAFMNMLKMEENAKYRQTVKNVLEYDHRILRRFVNFMNNPDERTAVEQFGKEGKYFGACVLLVTMPGLPMIGHGQIEGLHEKYGMEYRRAYWDETEDAHLVARHEAQIFPLMRRRHLFSGSENFVFYDFFSDEQVDENVFAYSNGEGGEWGLILYHNRYATTSGWIRTSTAIAGKNDKGETIIIQKTLGEGLGLNPDGRYYYSCRDYAGCLEYLYSGQKLCGDGLYVELGGYEFKAFLDFREIRDDEFGSWGKLCASLNGRGVTSLAEELKQVRHGAVVEGFRLAVGATARILADPNGEEEIESLHSLLDSFYGELNRHTGCSGDCKSLSGETLREIAAVGTLNILSEQGETDELGSATGTVVDRLLLAAFLVVHGAGKLAAVKEHPLVAASWLEELGFERAFAEAVADASEGVEEAGQQEEIASLLRPLLRWQRFFAGWERNVAQGRFTPLFADPGAREFLKCHTYEKHEWFNRERFEMLLKWFLTVEALDLAAGKGPEHLFNEIAPLRKALHHIQAAAAEGGFRVDQFLEMLQAGSPGAQKE
jgi:hypothetical protein